MERIKKIIGGGRKEGFELLKAQAFVGEKFENLLIDGVWELLNTEILNPMEEESFQTFKKLDPKDFHAVNQAQKYGQVVDEVRKRIERKIEIGRSARAQIIDLANQEE